MTDTKDQVKKWLDNHEKQDKQSFEAIHSHLDRIDDRHSQDKGNIDLIVYKLDELKTQVAVMEAKMDKIYVTKVEFQPVRNLVYGMVGILLTGVIGAILAIAIR